ncbi:MAG TPA: preprotein translocase subunit SecA [Bacillota bacterium]|jgi:preprotein translocase subunit SecA|nr:preprotein translocase subunit SecA [Peptococcaceae bacterium MAG4]NLW37508.1 preprotein translocase subunit SecA [Peptococcaceae bacterium]HPZ43624.1 preprotein translocase subunit SecA [Bacillota bacterium]HQD76134.1 preprotein translocase subunit SecA [Bacillota bacterium]HUM58837.1 preprotein translocase subunit SecA [Bacillota bacterium]
MLGFIKNWLDDNAREIKKLQRTVDEINKLEREISALSEAELKGKTAEFRERLDRGQTLDEILPEAFAVVREASRRVLGMRHFDVQLMGGIVLHQGRIAEMKTGEGKTLVATLPVYLNALTGKGVHVVTVNDYLARRDSEWMGQIYKYLGLSVGLIVHGLDWAERRQAYAADITYGTNNEFGFDYLRDNMALRPEQLVQRELNYAIVDEVDSILVDEARTPLIISGQAEKSTELYYTFARIVPKLIRDVDYNVDEKAHTVTITESGVAKVEKMLGVENLYDDKNIELTHHLNQALKAHGLMKRDRDYVVKDGQVIIVDEFTGRLMFGRRYSDGLHQAIEAKEGVKIERESQTLATITFQNYFRMYKKLAGMTGTAATEEQEFKKIYGLDVVVIPTNKPMIRVDLPDVVYKTEQAKFRAVVNEIAERHARGQPVLVGTISIEKSEILSSMLKRKGIPHQVLNAKYHEKEAEIVAQAGRLGAVTIATNMAGRGTDILLGGNPEFLARQELRKQGQNFEASGELAPGGVSVQPEDPVYQSLLENYRRQTEEERRRVVELGGLHIVGTERHESRRIDNQLRGRCGRQGDPGSTQFFSSLEDDLMRLFGSDNIAGIMDRLGIEEDVPIEHPMITKSIETAQKRVENRNFEIRKHVLEYDDVMNQQRELIYRQRRQVLTGENLKENVLDMIRASVERAVNVYAPEGVYPEEWDLKGLLDYAEQYFLPGHGLTPSDLEGMGRREMQEFLTERSQQAYDAREQELGPETMREIERVVMLRIVDEKWMDHLDAMDQLREGIGLRAYGQKDPLIEYKFEGYEMFQNMIASIQDDVVRYIFRVNVVQPQQEQKRQVSENRYAAEEGPKKPVRKENKVGRNDPCPCGSGKKYKKCCGRAAAV